VLEFVTGDFILGSSQGLTIPRTCKPEKRIPNLRVESIEVELFRKEPRDQLLFENAKLPGELDLITFVSV